MKVILLTALLLGFGGQASAQPYPDSDDPADPQPAPDADDATPEPAPPPAGSEPETTPAEPTTDVHVDVNLPPAPPPAEDDTMVVVTPSPAPIKTRVVEETSYIDRVGVSLSLGAGFQTFTDADTRAFTGPAGGWGARMAIGTREFLGLELGYSGSAQEIDVFGLDNDALLVSNGLDAALRINLGAEAVVQPFVFGGMGWRHFSVENSDTRTSSVNGSDDVLEFPVGAGIGYRLSGVNLELRSTFRASTKSDMLGGRDSSGDGVPPPSDIDDPSTRDSKSTLHTWAATLAAGWEF